jgi:pseudouridine-5'-phosphate glycosidase
VGEFYLIQLIYRLWKQLLYVDNLKRGTNQMVSRLPDPYIISRNIHQARQFGSAIVALESTVITHGLPKPDNLALARDMEKIVRENGAAPARIAILDGKIHIGLSDEELEVLAHAEGARKISLRDFGIALAGGLSGGTTVAGTLFVSDLAGIKVFATGGIGGVHRGNPFDVSADLTQLGKSPVVVVCSGAKAILDLPATREVLETRGVPVVGYQTDEFPAFYTRSSGLGVDIRANTPEETARIALETWEAGVNAAVLVVVPPPEETSMSQHEMESAVQEALADAEAQNIQGAAITPFLLKRVTELTKGDSLKTNLALLKNNARVAAEVASAIAANGKAGPY